MAVSPTKKLKRSLSEENVNNTQKIKKAEKKNKKKNKVLDQENTSSSISQPNQSLENNHILKISNEDKKGKRKRKKEKEQLKKTNVAERNTETKGSHQTQKVNNSQEINIPQTEDMKKKNAKRQKPDTVSDEVKMPKKKKKTGDADDQKKKKKKVSIKISKRVRGDEPQEGTGNRSLERQLSKIMSASRLSKYGLGPSASKDAKKKKKKKTMKMNPHV